MLKHRRTETAFTRNRKLNFTTLVTFLLNHRKGATQTELDRYLSDYFDDDRPVRHVTKSALIQARKQLSYEAFIELNHHFVENLYASHSKALKRWHGFRVYAVDGSQLRLPIVPELQQAFGCQSGVAGVAEQTMGLASVYYDVLNKIVIDARLAKTTESERYHAFLHLDRSQDDDLVVYDRGYNAIWMYAYHHKNWGARFVCEPL